MEFVTRFAPSPNGALHLGHAYSALLAHDAARRASGRFLLRIEDIDRQRCSSVSEAQIYEDLTWLGIVWEHPVRRQSEHFDAYRGALDRLADMGLVYPCFAARGEIAVAAQASGADLRDPDGAPLYPGLWRGAPRERIAEREAAGAPFALRLDMARAAALGRAKAGGKISFCAIDEDGREQRQNATPERWGDVILARKDVPTSYHLSVVVDDALQGISHVIRGLDLLAATDLHRLLQALLDLPEPVYRHHRLITDAEGRKLSKRDKDKSLANLRAEGATPDDIRAWLGLPADQS